MSLLMVESHPVAPPPPANLEPASERGIAASAADPMVLFETLRPAINLAIWHRPLPAPFSRSLDGLMRHAPFCHTAEAAPADAVDAIAAALPAAAPVDLLVDMERLAVIFAGLIGSDTIRMRLEAITGPACHRWHADAVGLRLLTTYRGPGTEWLALGGGGETARGLNGGPKGPLRAAIPTGAIAILKGEGYPGNAGWGCIHRSPPAGPGARARLLLCLDEPGRIPLAGVPAA
jgi:hypothetical protein